MTGNLQPLDQWMRIVKDDGTPTTDFIRWAQTRQIDITNGIDAATAQQLIDDWAAARDIIAGAGLTGGGDLSADRTLNVGAGTGISVAADAVNLADTAVTPGSYTNTNLTVDQQGRITAASNGSGGGGGGGSIFGQNTIGAASTSLFAGKGAIVIPSYGIEVTKIRQSINCANITHSYTAYILELNGSNVVQAITGTSAAVVPGVVSTAFRSFDFASPVTLVAGTRYALMVYLTNATGTTSSGAPGGSGLISSFPDELTSTFGRHAASTPSVGNTIDSGANQFHIGMVFSLT